MTIDAREMDFQALGRAVRGCADRRLTIENCGGQRFIASGLGEKEIDLYGVPGNALGAYLNGAVIIVHGNAQDAVGDTMNAGEIIIHGSAGDAPGYALRGGRILIRDNAGYRAGIHMKAYKDRVPVMVIGKSAGSFLGEYQAGGRIIVLPWLRGPKRGGQFLRHRHARRHHVPAHKDPAAAASAAGGGAPGH